MPLTQNNENLTQEYIRAFTQRGGPGPANPLRFAGAEEQYLMVGDITNPDRGGIKAININDPLRQGLFKRTGITIDAPDIPNAPLTFKQRFGGIPWYSFRLDCELNIYEVAGKCASLNDPINGWEIVTILSRGLSGDKKLTGRTPFDTTAESTTEITFSWLGGVYNLGGIVLGETAAQDITTEAVDVVYGNYQNCSNCGVADNGTQRIYVLQQTAGGSSAALGKVLYSTDGGATWASSSITGLGVGALVTAMDLAGPYLVVVVKGENAYYISRINSLTGVPGSWTKVTTGFVASKTPNDLYVESPNRVYFVGDGGYIYVSTNITQGVSVLSAAGVTTQNLLRIHGQQGILVATGATSTTLKSTNQGATWVATTASVTGTVQANAVYSPLSYWVGAVNGGVGTVYNTKNGGETWDTQVLPGDALISVHDILWATAEAGYILASRTGPTAAVFRTMDGGRNWGESGTALLPSGMPTFGRPNRGAVPIVPDLQVAANNIAVAGLGGGLTDGIVLVGSAAVL